jgi:hypothetical protein
MVVEYEKLEMGYLLGSTPECSAKLPVSVIVFGKFRGGYCLKDLDLGSVAWA